MRTWDEGRSWETLHAGMTAIAEEIEGNLYAGYFSDLGPHRLLGVFLWVDRSNLALPFVHPETTGLLPMRTLLAESPDGGETWSPFREVPLVSGQECSCTGPAVALADGVLALPYECWKSYGDRSEGRHAACLQLSFDQGQTWPERVTVAADPAGNLFFWDQRIARHPISGELVAMFWTHDRRQGVDLENHIAWGSADGRLWSVPQPVGWQGQHCQPVSVGGDQLVAVYVQRHDPPSLIAVPANRFGRNWRPAEATTFYASEAGSEPGAGGPEPFEDYWQDMLLWRFGHPRAVVLPGGDLLVAYYAGKHGATGMEWVRIQRE